MKVSQDKIDKGIYWQKPWQLVDGCTKVSEGCLHCWSEAIAKRFKRKPDCNWQGKIKLRWDNLNKPLHTKKPTVWAVWNDLFHPAVSYDFIVEAIDITFNYHARYHTFLVLTKRVQIMKDLIASRFYHTFKNSSPEELDHLWLGVTAENQPRADERIPVLHDQPAPGVAQVHAAPVDGNRGRRPGRSGLCAQ